MVSAGKEQTTCAYFLLDGKHIIYASTHLADDAWPPAVDRSQGYLWAVYASYDVFEAKEDGTELKRLTDTDGYDAEATVNWKTKKIIYTPLASKDLDLWTIKLDGSNKKRLTETYGYDGGAVFSGDGKKIAWRGNHPTEQAAKDKYAGLLHDNLTSPTKMKLFVGDANGKKAKQITNFGGLTSFPEFSPDGKKLVFVSDWKAPGRYEFNVFTADWKQ